MIWRQDINDNENDVKLNWILINLLLNSRAHELRHGFPTSLLGLRCFVSRLVFTIQLHTLIRIYAMKRQWCGFWRRVHTSFYLFKTKPRSKRYDDIINLSFNPYYTRAAKGATLKYPGDTFELWISNNRFLTHKLWPLYSVQ